MVLKVRSGGVRRYQNSDGTLTPAGKRRIQKEAKKDAKEFARAKMYYGDGAGNRRKLIKASVNEKSKDAFYKSEFEKALATQNMDEHAKKAKRERKANDTKESVKKTARGIYHTIAQDGAKVSAFVGALAAGYGVLHATGADKVAISKGKEFINRVVNGNTMPNGIKIKVVR